MRREVRALERARRRFVRAPTEERLHGVRTSGRRFRSLLEDVADLRSERSLLRRVKRAADATDAARDAAMALLLLETSVDEDERDIAAPLFETLRRRRRDATAAARRRLRRARFEL